MASSLRDTLMQNLSNNRNLIRRVDIAIPVGVLLVLLCGAQATAWASEITRTSDQDVATVDSDSLDASDEDAASVAESNNGNDFEDSATTTIDAVEPETSDADAATTLVVDDLETSDEDDALEAELRALEQALAADAEDTNDEDGAPDSISDDASGTAPNTGFQRTVQALNNALNPEISLTLNVAASYFSNEPMQVGHHDPNRNGFTFQQLEMAFHANVDPYFKFRGYLVVGEHGLELEEAFAQTTSLPGRLQLRAGKFLNRFGRINSRHPHAWHFLDMPLVMGRFLGDEGLSGTGIEASWLAPTPWYLELVMSAVHGAEARSFRGEDSSIDSVRDFVYVGAIKNHFAFGPSWSLALGVSGAFGRNNAAWEDGILSTPTADLPTHGLTQIYGTDLYLRFRPVDAAGYRAFSLQFEFMHRRREVGGMLLSNNGLYAQAIGNISQRWEVGARYEWVDGSALDDLDPEWTGDRHRMSVQGTFYPSHFSRIRLQTNYDRPTWSRQPIVAVMLGLELSIGAHGAHKF